ncbi:MAG TPA: hypothetical protein PLI65_03185 [Bacteroidales bacterium]|nr:hypothetical protein [Bacteroidales bacterium]
MGNIILCSQQDVNHFLWTEVAGTLAISGNDLTDLTPLNTLTSVGRNLIFAGNTLLPNLDGLAALMEVDSSIYFFRNEALTNVNRLSSLTSIGGDLSFYENVALINSGGSQHSPP